jgi:hypothetical protein
MKARLVHPPIELGGDTGAVKAFAQAAEDLGYDGRLSCVDRPRPTLRGGARVHLRGLPDRPNPTIMQGASARYGGSSSGCRWLARAARSDHRQRRIGSGLTLPDRSNMSAYAASKGGVVNLTPRSPPNYFGHLRQQRLPRHDRHADDRGNAAGCEPVCAQAHCRSAGDRRGDPVFDQPAIILHHRRRARGRRRPHLPLNIAAVATFIFRRRAPWQWCHRHVVLPQDALDCRTPRTGFRTFAGTLAKDEVAPKPAIDRAELIPTKLDP